MNPIEKVHQRSIHSRRVGILAQAFARLVPDSASVLDVGTGDGTLAQRISTLRGDIAIEGVEVSPREGCAVPVTGFDGRNLPFDDRSFDAVMFSDVLHHVPDPMVLLSESVRVTRGCILIKDHYLKGMLAGPTLRFMDNVGNARYNVPVPGHYWTERQWDTAFDVFDLVVDQSLTHLDLYPWFLNWWFGRSLHFVARLQKRHSAELE